jgi:purine-nucleoside phosphorylase
MYNINVHAATVAANYIKNHFDCELPNVGVILGSGLGGFTALTKILKTIKYTDIPNFPHGNVEGHKGSLSLVEVSPGRNALVMEGRLHFYEGFTANEVAFPVSVLHLLGVTNLIVSNAAGGINPGFMVGDLVIITDHINFTGQHPLIGRNHAELGPRFLDQTEPYAHELIKIAKDTSKQCNITPKEGVYIGVTGPTYETKAEIRAFGILGADAVGMSTIYEVIIANYLNMKVLGISNITNMATGIAKTKHEHQAVVSAADKVTGNFSNWVKQIILTV